MHFINTLQEKKKKKKKKNFVPYTQFYTRKKSVRGLRKCQVILFPLTRS